MACEDNRACLSMPFRGSRARERRGAICPRCSATGIACSRSPTTDQERRRDRIFSALRELDGPDLEYLMFDTTIVRSHQHAAGAKRGGVKIDRSGLPKGIDGTRRRSPAHCAQRHLCGREPKNGALFQSFRRSATGFARVGHGILRRKVARRRISFPPANPLHRSVCIDQRTRRPSR